MTENKTHWRKCDKSDYLGACDFEDTSDVIATIKEVRIEKAELRGKDAEARVAYFKEDLKPMVINVSNGKILKKFNKSSYIEDWADTMVQIYIKNDVKMAGEITDGLRFREVQPKKEKREITPESNLWQKAIDNLSSKEVDIKYIEKNYKISAENKAQLLKLITPSE